MCYYGDTFLDFMKISRKNLDRPATVRDLQDFVTKDYFEKRLDEFGKKLEEKLEEKLKNYVTKEYLVGYVDMKFAELDERFVSRTEFREAMDRIYTSFDRIFYILENKEWEMTKHVVSRHEKTLLNHDRRLSKLEAAR